MREEPELEALVAEFDEEELAEALADDEDADVEDIEPEEAEKAEPDEDQPHRDTGELYGLRTPHASDREISAGEDHDGFIGAESGENFLESLEEHAAEMGPLPEEEVVVVDDSDPQRGHHSTEGGDPPVADKGSGGPGGL